MTSFLNTFCPALRWLLAGLLWLLATPWGALGQVSAPFAVGVTTPTSLANPLPAGSSVTLTAAAQYPAFSVVAGLTGTVNMVAVQADGKLLLAGQFNLVASVGGSTITRTNIARLRADGSLDPSFEAAGSFGSGDYIGTIAVQTDGNILVGGHYTFTATGGTPVRSYVMRLTPAGQLDPTFAPRGPGAGVATGLDGGLDGITVQTDGKILVGGSFTHYNNGTATALPRAHIARLNPNGGLDEQYAQQGYGFDTGVGMMAVQPDGKVVAAGAFHFYRAGTATPIARNYLARLNTDGTLDRSFAPPNGGAGFVNLKNNPFDGTVEAFALQPDGRIVVGGRFTHYNDGTARPRAGIARLNADGSLDGSFAPTGAGFNYTTRDPSNNNIIFAVLVQPDNKILVGGSFSRYHASATDSTARSRVARLNADGSLDSFTPPGGSSSNPVLDVALQPNGRVVVGGINTIDRLTATGPRDDTALPVLSATYAWSNGSTGPTLTVLTSGTYSATATAAGQSVTSNPVAVAIVAPAVASFAVRITPAGPISLCPTPTTATNIAGRTLTAVVVPAPAAPATIAYQWHQAQATGATSVPGATGSTFVVPGLLTAGASATYFATATIGGATAASANVTLSTLPPPTLAVTPGSGLPGTSVSLTGTNLGAVTGVFFGNTAAVFTRTSATQLTATVPAGATNDVTVSTGCATATAIFTVPVPPSITSIVPTAGAVGSTVTITGMGFTSAGAATIAFNGVAATPTGTPTNTQLTVLVPPGATTGPITVSTPPAQGGTATSAGSFTVQSASNVTINTTTGPGARTTYDNLTIIRPGVFTLTHDITVTGRLEVQDGATLNDSTFRVLGNSFVLAAGGTLQTKDPAGISSGGATGGTGAIQTTTRSFSPAASYAYTGTLPQRTGTGLPSRVLNLTSRNADSLKLTRPVAVTQVLTMAGAGNFYLNNQMLTLLSGANGTALVHNQGTGVVVGTATVQRYIDPTINPTAGFRYYGAPVRGATAAAFKVPAFAYDQARSLAFVRQDTLPDISVGFVPTPLAAGAFLEVGRGYRAAVPAADTVRFVGTLTTGNDTVNLLRSSRKAYSGWNLVSNPYPSPLNWNKIDPADRPGLEAAIYVYESTGPGTGYFRSYVYRKLGTGDSLIAAGQAFFVRVRQNSGTQASTGRLIFRNSQRVTAFDNQTQPIFNRTAVTVAVEPQLDVVLERNGGCRPCRPTGTAATQAAPATQVLSRVTVYTNSAATADFDPLLDADAGNLINLNQQTLGIRVGGSTRSSAATDTLALLAVQAVPPFSPTRVTRVPLVLGATAPGIYTLGGAGQNLPALLNGATAYLRDSSATTNNWISLPTATPYAFLLTAAELLTKAKTVRFWLHFGPGPVVPLATAASVALQSTTVYPNPAREQFSVRVPAVAGTTQVQATLLSPLGQVVQQQVAALPAAGATLYLSVPGQASGMYLLRLQAGSSTIMRRIVLE